MIEYSSKDNREITEVQSVPFWVMSILEKLLFWIRSERLTFKKDKLEELLNKSVLLSSLVINLNIRSENAISS